MQLSRSASLAEVFNYLEEKPVAVVLFIDQTKFNQDYANFPWVKNEAAVVEIDQEILDSLQIGKVPQFRFYIRGNEVLSLIGTVPFEEFSEAKQKVFGNVKAL
jgi:thiol-disulfide isomerase/thioredoxin